MLGSCYHISTNMVILPYCIIMVIYHITLYMVTLPYLNITGTFKNILVSIKIAIFLKYGNVTILQNKP